MQDLDIHVAPDDDDVSRALEETVNASRLMRVSTRLDGDLGDLEGHDGAKEDFKAPARSGWPTNEILTHMWAKGHFCVPGYSPQSHSAQRFSSSESSSSPKAHESKSNFLAVRTRWQDSLLEKPLHDFEPESARVAIQFFRNVTGFMKDRKSSLSPVEHVQKIIRNAIGATQRLQTELFCQVVKQTTDCPPVHRAGSHERINECTIRGWKLMAVLVTLIRPQRSLFPALLSYVKSTHADAAKGSEVGRLAKYCHAALVVTKGLPPRTAIPMMAEVHAIINQDLMTIQVEMVNGRRVACKIASWVTVRDLCDQISEQLGVHATNMRCFSLFQGFSKGGGSGSNGVDRLEYLQPDDFVADIIGQWQDDFVALGGTTQKSGIKPTALNIPHRYLRHRVNVYIDVGSDRVSKCLYFIQAIADVVDGACILPDDITFRLIAHALYFVHDHGSAERTPSQNDEIDVLNCYKFLPERFLYPVSRRVQSLSRIIEELKYVRTLCPRQFAPLYFMKLALTTKKLLGRCWEVGTGTTHLLPDPCLVCVHPKGICLIDPASSDIAMEFSWYAVQSWGASPKAFVLNVRREMDSKKIVLRSDTPRDIAYQCDVYSKAVMNGQNIDTWTT